MKSFLNKVGKTATAAASKAGNKASELIEIGKIKGKISSQKQDMAEAKRKIGEHCYELFKAEKIEDERIKELCETIAACEALISDLEQRIEDVKDDYNTETCEDSSAAE